MTLGAVDWDALLTAVWASFVAGVGVSAAFGFVILGGARAVELRRDGYVGAATLFGALGLLGALVVVAAIVFGLIVVTE
jgi:uncharacterized membrane protein